MIKRASENRGKHDLMNSFNIFNLFALKKSVLVDWLFLLDLILQFLPAKATPRDWMIVWI